MRLRPDVGLFLTVSAKITFRPPPCLGRITPRRLLYAVRVSTPWWRTPSRVSAPGSREAPRVFCTHSFSRAQESP